MGIALSPSEIYRVLVKARFFRNTARRDFIDEVIRSSERVIAEGKGLIVDAPPGIGKTAIPVTYAVAKAMGYTEILGVNHVLPLRTLVYDTKKRFREGMEAIGLKHTEPMAAIQYGLYHESPYFSACYVISTVDTFMLNLLKVPTAAYGKIVFTEFYGHYEIPRASILTLLNVFDEFHLMLESERGMKTLITTLKCLSEVKTPFITMTSTLPRIYINQITKLVRNVEVKTYNPRPGDGFYDVEISKKFIASDGGLVEVKDITDIIELLEKQESSGSRSCLIVNTVRRAIDVYEELGSKALLLHSRYTVRDRKMKIESLELKDRVVSTQVIEAGVDTSFDVMVTELAPISSVIQRLGRLARRPSDKEGVWCVFFDKESLKGNGIYDEVMVKETLEVLNEVADKRINWHLPTIIGGKYLGYKDILEYVWSRYVEKVSKDKVTLTIDPSIKEILMNPLVDPKQVLKYLIDIRSFVREDVMGPIYVDEPPNDYVSYINTIQDHLIPTNLDYAFRYVCKALERGYDVAKIVRLGRDGVGTDSFRCDEKIDDFLKDIITGRLLAFLIPKELYDGGEGGVGLKPIRR